MIRPLVPVRFSASDQVVQILECHPGHLAYFKLDSRVAVLMELRSVGLVLDFWMGRLSNSLPARRFETRVLARCPLARRPCDGLGAGRRHRDLHAEGLRLARHSGLPCVKDSGSSGELSAITRQQRSSAHCFLLAHVTSGGPHVLGLMVCGNGRRCLESTVTCHGP